MKNKKTFNMVDFIFCKAFQSKTSDRGKWERDLMAKHTADSMNDLTYPFSMRALNVTTSTAGGHTVAKLASEAPAFGGLYDDSFFLSNAIVVDNLTSDIKITSKTAGTLTNTSVGETVSNTFTADPTFADLTITPHFIRVSIELSFSLIEQSSLSLSDLILNDMKRALSQELDRQVCRGTGATDIGGLDSKTGISSDTWGALASLTGGSAFEKVTEAEGNLASNKIPGPYFFLMNGNTRKTLRGIRMANFNYPILTDDGRVIGRDVVVTEQLPDASCYFLSPEFLIIGLFHPADSFNLQIDPHSKSNEGLVVLTLSILADSSLSKPKSVSIITES